MYLEAHWEMYKVKIQIIQLQISERPIQTDGDVLRSMMSPPQLSEESEITEHSRLPPNVGSCALRASRLSVKCDSGSFLIATKVSVHEDNISAVRGPHLTDDEHVLSFDDTLAHLGFQSLANIGFVLVTVSCVNVAITSGDGGLHCSLDFGLGTIGGLQQVKSQVHLSLVPWLHVLKTKEETKVFKA